jgi:glycogen operon protein
MSVLKTARGRSLPLGATALADGVNFALLCRHGTSVRLVLLPEEGVEVLAEIRLHPLRNRTGDHWHVLVEGLPPIFRYGWRVDGPKGDSHRFNPEIILLDPSTTAIADGSTWSGVKRLAPAPAALSGLSLRKGRRDAKPEQRVPGPGTNGHAASRYSLFVRRPYEWNEDAPPLTPLEDSVIYELHVRGFTCHPTSGVAHPGTFAGLVEKIPHLLKLGVTAVELLPVHEFDEDDCPFTDPQTGEGLRNFWGYNSIAFGAPKAAYAASGAAHGQLNEFREMVRAFHNAGLEVILDVVFNHTGEGDDRGRTYSFRGLDNELYYMLGPGGAYLNFSGCGNTVNVNHPIVRELILNCLRFWVAEMHIDGLRFDLASVFGRDPKGNVLVEPPIVEMIAEDGVLAGTKLIAEPWDAGGLYQVGGFPFGRRWSEWNGRYRDDVRRFWRGEAGFAGALATRLCGSSDLYEAAGRKPAHSVNFITCHDGFTLWDLVSHNHKHNDANGEAGRDGMDDNFSWNCGAEGPSSDPEINRLRKRQAKNLLATLMLSQGVPMLLCGDEFLRTQKGNNNAWCQDNTVSWVDWGLADKNGDFLRFTSMLIALRKRHPGLRRSSFFRGTGPGRDLPSDIIWHGTEPFQADFTPGSRTLAFCLDGSQSDRASDSDFYVACNGWRETIGFRIPPSPTARPWRRVIDTSLLSPLDIVGEGQGPVVASATTYPVIAHSIVVLISD